MRKRFLKIPRLAAVVQGEEAQLVLTFQSAERRLLDLSKAELQLGAKLPRGPVRINEFYALEWPEASLELEGLGDLAELIDEVPSRFSIGADTAYGLSSPMDPDFREVLGRRIKRLRAELGLSQSQVAQRMGTQRTYISQVENGRSDIEIQSLKRLIEVGLGRELEIRFR
jgi:DNA-binding XRE family transcriptional regulator